MFHGYYLVDFSCRTDERCQSAQLHQVGNCADPPRSPLEGGKKESFFVGRSCDELPYSLAAGAALLPLAPADGVGGGMVGSSGSTDGSAGIGLLVSPKS